MVADPSHSSDISSKQEVIPNTEKIARLLEINKQNTEVYSALSGENRALKKQLEEYHSQHSILEMKVKRLERNMRSIKTELEDLNECMDIETVVDLIHEIVPSLIGKKDKDFSYSSESSEDSDSVEIIKVRKKKAVPYKQRKRA